MGYYLNAFLGRPDSLKIIKDRFRTCKVVLLTAEIALIPMTGELFDEINNFRSNHETGTWRFLTTNVENEILALIENDDLAYVEVEYFGGQGAQSGIIWTEGKRWYEKESGQEVLNTILRHFGVIKEKSKKDEFDTVGLGRHRNTNDWIEAG